MYLSSVCIRGCSSGWTSGKYWLCSRNKQENVLCLKASRPAFGPTRPHILLVSLISFWYPSYPFGIPHILLVSLISFWYPSYPFGIPQILLVSFISFWYPSYPFGIPHILLVSLISFWYPSYPFGIEDFYSGAEAARE